MVKDSNTRRPVQYSTQSRLLSSSSLCKPQKGLQLLTDRLLWLSDTHTNVMLAKWSADPHSHRSRLVRVTLSTGWATLEPVLCRRKSKNSDGRQRDIDRDGMREKSLCHVVCI